ncbi:MAG: ABC transporter substrate-binding protein [bacterium]
MNKAFKYTLSIIAILVLIMVGYTASQKTIDNSPVKIGVVLPLSGDLAFIGEPAKKGAELALEQFKNTKRKYELVFEDDQYDSKKTITSATKLISINKVEAVVSFGSAQGNVVKPLAVNNKTIHFAVASDPNIADGKYNFNHWTPAKEEVKTLVAELVNKKIKSVSVLTINNEGMIALESELKKQLQNTGISILADERFNVGSRDFRTLITKLKSNLPEVLVMLNTTPELEILAKQIKDSGIKTPMTSVEVFDATSNPPLFKGYWYATAGDSSEIFISNYKNKYSSAPSIGTGNVADIISLIVAASEKIDGKVTAENISQALHSIQNMAGAMGDLSIDAKGSVISKASIKVMK